MDEKYRIKKRMENTGEISSQEPILSKPRAKRLSLCSVLVPILLVIMTHVNL